MAMPAAPSLATSALSILASVARVVFPLNIIPRGPKARSTRDFATKEHCGIEPPSGPLRIHCLILEINQSKRAQISRGYVIQKEKRKKKVI